MKEGKISFLATLWWLIISFGLGLLLVFLAPKEARPSMEENRMLSGAPELTVETLFSGTFFAGVEDYLSDGFFQRDRVIDSTDSLLSLFDLRTEEQRLIEREAETNRLLADDAGNAQQPHATSATLPTGTITASVTPAPTASPTVVPTHTPTTAPTATPTNTPTPAPTATPTPTPTPTPTAPPSASPAVIVTAYPTKMPQVTNTVVPTNTPTLVPTPTVTPVPTPYATITPVPTATPKVIVPLEEDDEAYLYLIRSAEKREQNYTYSADRIISFANSLNHLKTLLPEDGEVHYLQVPVAAVGIRLCIRNSQFIGWESTLEDALQSQVVNNVYVHNIPAILNDHLVAKETDLYYFSDHHWSPKGAWYALEAIMQARGLPVVGYDEYQYQRKLMNDNGSGTDDWIEAMYPLAPVHSVVLKNITDEYESVLIDYRAKDYSAFLDGTKTPWRRIDTGYGTDRRALVICDSFGNAFVPYLLPYYCEVHMTDLRSSYYNEEEAGGTLSQLVDYHQIDDIYVILSTSNGINSPNSQEVFPKLIAR